METNRRMLENRSQSDQRLKIINQNINMVISNSIQAQPPAPLIQSQPISQPASIPILQTTVPQALVAQDSVLQSKKNNSQIQNPQGIVREVGNTIINIHVHHPSEEKKSPFQQMLKNLPQSMMTGCGDCKCIQDCKIMQTCQGCCTGIGAL